MSKWQSDILYHNQASHMYSYDSHERSEIMCTILGCRFELYEKQMEKVF